MSYLIQNSVYPAHSIKISLRVRASFLARNVGVIYTLLSAYTKAFNLPYPVTQHNLHVLVRASYLFSKFAKVLFKPTKFLRYTPVGINFPSSAHYRALANLGSLLAADDKFMPFANPRTDSYFSYPYYARSWVAITPITKKPFSLALHKFLRMNLDMWFYWPRAFKISSNFTDINSSWVFSRFLNKYFFRVYTI